MRALGLKSVLIISILSLVGVSVAISNYLSYARQKSNLSAQIIQAHQRLVADQSHLVEQFISEKIQGLKGLGEKYKAALLPAHNAQEYVELSQLFATTLNTGSSFIGLEKSGDAYWNLTSSSWPDHKFEGDIRKMQYYQDGRKAITPLITAPYPDEADPKIYWISMVQRIEQGMIGADMKLGFLNKLVVDVAKEQKAVALILNQDSMVLASSEPDAIKPGEKALNVAWLKPSVESVVQNTQTTYELKRKAGELLFSHRINVANQHWYFAIIVDKSDVFASLVAARHAAMITTVILILVSIVVAFLVIQLVYRPILSLKSMVSGLSSGDADLTQRLTVSTNDDLGQIAQSVNLFVDKLQSMMKDIRRATLTLADNIEQMEQFSKDNSAMLNHHVTETEQVVTAIDQMSATASAMANDIANAADLAQRTNEESFESSKLVAKSQNNIASLINGVDNASERVNGMNEETKNINTILKVIGEISEQTNLLALNAAIEAARAGDQGRGFAVVADEVRQLAMRTQQSTKEIEEVLNRLVLGSQDIVTAMEQTKNQCEQTAQEAQGVATGLEVVIQSVAEINDLSQQIATAAEEQTSVTEHVSMNMNALNEIVSNLASNGEKTHSGMKAVASVNQQLTEIVERFKV
ncbi:methyl-accepting chemotaxis protein [Celerinatantimonas sp. MCCC 1A17872]|uniref:methyl-accepting chemotaxis protein n=1 Tax=Celerinatantimonas sp. MCCC 1A17872 TaxID=3177514 RepID=UPI0038C2308D